MLSFTEKVYRAVRKIPRGRVATYAQVARAISRPRAFRAVGNVLNKNKDTKNIPCHRVVRSDGALGGYVFGSVKKKEKLKQEGIYFKGNNINLKIYLCGL